jgi:hypothetical protein
LMLSLNQTERLPQSASNDDRENTTKYSPPKSTRLPCL